MVSYGTVAPTPYTCNDKIGYSRVCAGFYCDKDMKYLMIPEGRENREAKKFDGNEVTPQRVCLSCAPELEPLQDELCKCM